MGIPKGIDGKSFKKQILESGVSTNEFDIVFSQNQFGRMVRYDEFKYVRSVVYGITYEILYDIDKDPTESENLLEDPKFKNQLIKGRKLLDNWLVNEGTELIAER